MNKKKGTAENKRRCETQSENGMKEPTSSKGSLCETPGKKALNPEINSLVISATSRDYEQSPAKNLSFVKNPELETTMVDRIQELTGSLSPENPTLSMNSTIASHEQYPPETNVAQNGRKLASPMNIIMSSPL